VSLALLEYFIRFFVLGKAIRHAEDCVMTKEIETTKPHKQTKQTAMAHYVDDSLFHFRKTKSTTTAVLQRSQARSGETMAPWNIGNALAKTST
jgi:hypothetical protein